MNLALIDAIAVVGAIADAEGGVDEDQIDADRWVDQREARADRSDAVEDRLRVVSLSPCFDRVGAGPSARRNTDAPSAPRLVKWLRTRPLPPDW